MDIVNFATKMLGDKLGGTSGDSDTLKSAIGKLLGGGDNLDLDGLISGLKEKGLGDIADSWLGDGDNAEISVDQLKNVIGEDKIKAAAVELGGDEVSLLDGLKEALPSLIDKASSGGSLLDNLGGLSGITKKLF